MKSKQFRTFMINDKEMIFNQEYFGKLFLKKAAQNGYRVGEYEFEVAEALYVDKSAVHNWRMGKNGPGDLEKIQLLANLWNINYEVLLMEVTTMTTATLKTGLTDREKTALKNVYTAFLNYMNVFENSTGFVWNEDNSSFNMRYAYSLYEQTKYVLEMEYIDLKKSVYDQLKEFYNKELTYTLENCYDEEDGDCPEIQQAQTLDLYEELLKQFKSIVDPYLLA